MLIKRKFFIPILIIIGLIFSTSISNQKVSAQWYACGKTSPDAQIFPNCADGAAPDWCRADSTQPAAGGWLSGPDATSRRLKTGPGNPAYFGVQCFQYLSVEGGGQAGGITPVKVVVTGPNFYQEQSRSWGTTAFIFPAYEPGTYTATCYAADAWGNLTCNASTDSFTVIPRCQNIAPVAATLSTPANNGSVKAGSNATLTFVMNGWGDRCPSPVRTLRVEVSPGCSGSWTTFSTSTTATTATIPSSYLVEGQTYCWRVVKNNGFGGDAISSTFRFNVIDDRIDVDLNATGVQADVCGGGFSGKTGISGVSNPIDFQVDFNTSSANKYREIWLAAVPDNVTFNNCSANVVAGVCSYKEGADIQTEALILSKAKQSKAFAFKLILDATGNLVQAMAYNGTAYVPVTSGDISGLGATLLDFKGATTFNPITGTGNFRVRFDSTLYGKFAFYTAAIITDANGVFKGSYDRAPNAPYEFKRVKATATLTNWGVDLTPPAASTAFGNPKYTAADKFQVNWTITDPNTLQLRTFASRDNADGILKDTTAGAGLIDFNIPVPDLDAYNDGTLRFSSITPWNAYVTQANVGTRTYQDMDTSKQTNFQFYGFATDAACNQKAISTSAVVQKPWLISYNGNVSAAKGITGITAPSGLDQFSETLKSTGTGVVLTDQNAVYLSSYASISGTTDLPSRKISKLEQYVTNYDDLTIKPPIDSGFTSWYDYLLDLVTKNSSGVLTTLTGTDKTIAAGNTSTFLGAAANAKAHVIVQGNLTVARGVTCNTQTIFFVKGNTTSLDTTYTNTKLKISPDFRVSGNDNGCLFVTKGDILIDNGVSATGSVAVDLPALARYDVVEAALISDGKLITLRDVAAATVKGDGLSIKGSVVTEGLTLQRDVNLNANQLQPAQLFIFDPRYREIFKNDLNYNKYSIREVGFVTPE